MKLKDLVDLIPVTASKRRRELVFMYFSVTENK